MHPYIKYLLQDIKKAERSENENLIPSHPSSFEEEMVEIERYISGEGQRPFSYFTGLKRNNFPPNEQLSEEDIKLVMQTWIKMFKTWNASIDFPRYMPLREQYEFLRNSVLETDFTPVNSGCIHFDFCSGHAPDCDWGKYCQCLDVDQA